MLKIEYKINSLFSLKKYDYSHLNAMSYEYLTQYAIRSAILGSIIKIEGVEYAKTIFNKIKNSIIYVQYNPNFTKTQQTINRTTNRYYNVKYEDTLDLLKAQSFFTIGIRERVFMDNLVFYIDKSIPHIELYLKNIDWLGDSESLVYLDSIIETNELTDIMQKSTDITIDKKIYAQHDWNKKVKFDDVYLFNKRRKHKEETFNCQLTNVIL